jgi:hypothetical protein
MKRGSLKVWIGVMVFYGGSLLSSSALAQKESCKQCKYIECLKSAIKQKETMMQGYGNLAGNWAAAWPGDVIDLEQVPQPQRLETMAKLNQQFTQLRNDEESLANAVGPPKKCGFTDNVEMSTDSVQCLIDMTKAAHAEQAVPCKEIYDIAFRHEAMHLQKCQERKGNRTLPAKLLTPAGKAREEMAGYAQEIAELKKLLDETLEGRLEYDMEETMKAPQPIGTIVFRAKGNFPFKIDDQNTISGGGTYQFSADTAGSRCRYSGVNREYGVKLSGTLSGNDLQFHMTPTITTVIPSFRITCPPNGWGYSMPVNRPEGDFQMPKQDGYVQGTDFSAITGGMLKGYSNLTLRICPEPNP